MPADFPISKDKSQTLSNLSKQNQDELSRLVRFPGVENVSVDFGIEERNVAAQSERFPPNLLRMLGRPASSLNSTYILAKNQPNVGTHHKTRLYVNRQRR